MRTKRRLVIGLLAHVDAGKTTLSEGMLYLGGAVRRLGRVDHRDAFLDTDAQERERGITIFSKQAELSWKSLALTLLDTPGHVDFSGEMERALGVLDCAILVVSGADGVQGHTLTLWRLLAQYRIPVFLFINKMDQPGTAAESLLAELKARLSDACLDFTAADPLEDIALCSEGALNHFLETGGVPDSEIAALIASRRLFPCYFGSALKLSGVEALLDGLERLGPAPVYPADFSARVYKIARDAQGARLTYMKITGGCLRVRDALSNRRPGMPEENIWEEKASQIRLYSGARFQAVEQAEAGCVCAVTGLNFTRAGEGMGLEGQAAAPVMEPVFTYQALPPEGCDPAVALQKLRLLEEEEPQLRVIWNEGLREIHVQLMGEVQLEVLTRLLKDRFDLSVRFGEGSILYRETIAAPVEGIGHYEPLRHYAEVHLLLEPGARGSGLQFSSVCPEDSLEGSWQRLILTHLQEKRHLGVLTGAPITDMRMTLLAGRAHLKHTEGGDFRQATYRAVRQGLRSAQSILLEPWYDLRLILPNDCVGRAMHDLQQMGGQFQPPETLQGETLLLGAAPVAKARYYAREVTAYTRGRGQLQCALRGYAPCQEQEKVISAQHYDCDRDLENTADSIFCAHGAGFSVKWDRVREYMHIDTGYGKTRRVDAAGAQSARAAIEADHDPLAEDRALMQIFERTYGPIKPRSFLPTPRAQRPEALLQTYLPPEPEYLLVDGYNIIFAWEELKKVAKESLAHARLLLMDILSNYQGFRPCEVVLVFDAYKVQNNPGSVEKYQNITVVYTREAQTADSYIEKATYQIESKYRVRVATSDGLEQMIILGHGALRISAAELRAQIEGANREITAILRQNNRPFPSQAMEQALRNAWGKKRGEN